MVSFDMKFMYLKLSFVLVIIFYMYFISNYQNDPEITINDNSNLNSIKITTTNGIKCDKVCAQNCINKKQTIPIEINECFEKCLCLDEIKSNLVSKNFSLSEKIKHTIVFGFLMILFIYLYRNFDTIKPSYSGSLNEYHRISVNDNYYELRE